MISRRLLRVKVLQILYAFHKNDNRTIANAERELFFSIGKPMICITICFC